MVSLHLQLALAWIGLINTRNGTGMASVMTDDFVSIIRPTSMGFAPTLGKSAYIDRIMSSPITNFNISLPTPDNTVEDTDVVQFYTTANGSTKHGFPWDMEYMFTFHYKDDKIAGTIEFVDSATLESVFLNESIASMAELHCST